MMLPDALHPQVRQLAERAAASGRLPAHEGTVDAARAASAAFRALLAPPTPMRRTVDFRIEAGAHALAARLFVPEGEVDALIVYCHGGGWVMGSIDGTAPVATNLARQARAAVLVVDYRLAPEHPYPAGLSDTEAALWWAHLRAKALLGREVPVVVAGESAGANLATVAAGLIGRRCPGAVAAQVLVCPPTDARCATESYREFAGGPVVSAAAMDWFWGHYLPDARLRSSPLVSPLLAVDLHWQPPALVLTAQCDPVRDDGELYAQALIRAGVPVVAHRFPGMCHGFFTMLGLVDGAAEAAAYIGRELPRLLARAPG